MFKFEWQGHNVICWQLNLTRNCRFRNTIYYYCSFEIDTIIKSIALKHLHTVVESPFLNRVFILTLRNWAFNITHEYKEWTDNCVYLRSCRWYLNICRLQYIGIYIHTITQWTFFNKEIAFSSFKKLMFLEREVSAIFCLTIYACICMYKHNVGKVHTSLTQYSSL